MRPPGAAHPRHETAGQHHQDLPKREHRTLPTHVQTAWPLTACCTQQTITVPPAVAAKTRQKHDYPSKEHRISYARRTGAERTFSTLKDPATTTIARGWCRLMGLASLTLWLACLLAVRNQRILGAFTERQARLAA